MADSAKYLPVGGGGLVSDLKTLSPLFRSRRRTVAFVYGFMFAFVAFTVFLVFTPSSNSASPLFTNIFAAPSSAADTPGAHLSSLFSYFFPNVSTPQSSKSTRSNPQFRSQRVRNHAAPTPPPRLRPVESRSDDSAVRFSASGNSQAESGEVQRANRTTMPKSPAATTANGVTGNPNSKSKHQAVSNSREDSIKSGKVKKPDDQASIPAVKSTPPTPTPTPPLRVNKTAVLNQNWNPPAKPKSQVKEKGAVSNLMGSMKEDGNNEDSKLLKSMAKCDLFDGEWVRDDSYPLYEPGSCPLIDEQFNCFLNGRPDQDFQKLKWKPKGCNLPRLDGGRMLELLRGKRLVFVGDSLNRNMWESLVCILRNSAKDRSKVFESSGRQYFRTDASYSFIFQDYSFSVEFFVTPFLVQEWEVSDKNGSKKETLRLDMVEKSSDNYRDADFLIFNTGHWWTHEKTSTGKDYYQEGSHVYSELNVVEAFRRALTTWARWIDANINPKKSMVFFRGYSASHFSGGQWNSGGQCDHETEPIKNKTYLAEYPPKMSAAERVMRGMKTHVAYMNVTRMTDYRKDGHPSIYRKQNLSEEERRSPLMFQDCSHWCLPGVPDSWNELLYAEILRNHLQQQQRQRRQPKSP